MRCNESLRRASCVAGVLLAAAASAPLEAAAASAAPSAPACSQAGLQLPPGFCATVFARRLGHARHLAVAANGVVYVNTWSGSYYDFGPVPAGGFLLALQDTTGGGKANVIERFGPTAAQGAKGGTGIAVYKGALYAEEADRIVRYALTAGSIVPHGPPRVVVSGLPLSGDHPMHPFAIDADGTLYIDVASATNACQAKNRQLKSPGASPCRELETRAGIWRYDANKTGQKFSAAARYATGIRNAEGIAVAGGGHGLYATQHGRDQLHENWPELYRAEEEATQPAEELLHVEEGGDYGWPECYFDEAQGRLVLAPEYGGDGGREIGPCTQKLAPTASFPAHWAPNGLMIYTGESFPARYHGGAFIAFHGSWDRAPYPQGGYNIVFQPLGAADASDRGQCEVFADGFAGAVKEPGRAQHRPSGVAVAPDGALFVSDDVRGWIYRISYRGDGAAVGAAFTRCPPPDAPAGEIAAVRVKPPEGAHPDAGAVNLPVPPGSSRAAVELGDQVFHGRVGGAGCTGCHGSDARGTPLGPSLAGPNWLWSDGSYAGLERTVRDGVAEPKQYRSPMPPMGGASLTPEQVAAVAAYVWALSH